MACRCCGSQELTPAIPCFGGDGHYHRCAFCGSLSADWAYPADVYDDDYMTYNERELGSRAALRSQLTGHVAAFGELQPGRGRFLDVGCLDGAAMEVMRDDGWDVWGWDVLPVADHIERQTGIPRDRVDCGGGLDRSANRFDAVLCRETLEHVPDPLPFLRDVIRCARPGAVIQIQTPREDDEPGTWNQRPHLQIFATTWLRTVIEFCGAEILAGPSLQWPGGQLWTCRRRCEVG